MVEGLLHAHALARTIGKTGTLVIRDALTARLKANRVRSEVFAHTFDDYKAVCDGFAAAAGGNSNLALTTG